MINFKTVDIETNKNVDELISSLAWQTHPVDILIFAEINTFSGDTNKPFVGKIDKTNHKFGLIRIRPSYQNFLPHILIKGQFITEADKTKLKLQFRLGLFTTALFVFLICLTGKVIWQTLNEKYHREEIWDIIIWFLIFPVGAVLFTMFELNKSSDKIFELLGIEESENNT